MKRVTLAIGIISTIVLAACQKDVATAPNRSTTGDLLSKYIVRDSANRIQTEVLFFYDNNTNLSVIKTPRSVYTPPIFRKVFLIDSFYRDMQGKTTKHVLRMIDSATQLFLPDAYATTVNYISNTDKVNFAKNKTFDDQGNLIYIDSSSFSYYANGNIKEVNIYQDSLNNYVFFEKHQFDFDINNNMLAHRIYQPRWNNNGDTSPIHKLNFSQFDNSKKYILSIAFIDAWLLSKKNVYVDFQKSMFSKYDEINYNNNGTDPQLYDITTVYNANNNRPDSCAWIPRVSVGVKKVGIKFYYQ